MDSRLFFLFAFLLAFRFMAQANTIASVQSGDWHDPKTWEGELIPTAGDDVVISWTFDYDQ